jgi:hypothetical protein
MSEGLPCRQAKTLALLNFTRARLGTRWNKCGSDKLCVLSYANIQARIPTSCEHSRANEVRSKFKERDHLHPTLQSLE